MLCLSGATRDVMRLRNHPNMGVLTSPRKSDSAEYIMSTGLPWGMDNDAFSSAGFQPKKFMTRLFNLRHLPRCVFVAAPDIIQDAPATLENFVKWADFIKSLGFPVALVGQDGMENLVIPWSLMNAFFVGGSTEWKLGASARWLISEAKRRDLWVHMGRVNSIRRIRYAQLLGCDSVDGTGYSINPSHLYRHLPVYETRQLSLGL